MQEYFYTKEIVQTYRISEKFIRECLQNQWIEPLEQEPGKLAQEDVARLLLIRDLMEDMGVNDESVPIILNLIDQLHALQGKTRWLGEKVKEKFG
jgi:chaperone modulatory protein CbpM